MSNTPEQEMEGKPDDMLAFSRIKEEIEKKAKEESAEILKEANAQVEEIKKSATQKSMQIKNEILGKANREADNIKVRELSRKKLALKMDYLETREKIFNEILLEARTHIQEFAQTPEYTNLIKQLSEEGCIGIGGGNLIVQVRKEDKSIFTKDFLSELSQKAEKATSNATTITLDKSDLKTLGGVKIMRDDAKLFVDNTFEKRLERADDGIRVELMELLS